MIFAPVSRWRFGGVGCAGFDRYVCSALKLVRGSQARAITGPIALLISRFGWGLNFSGTTKQVQTGNPLYAIPGMLASLWTPQTSDMTAAVLGIAAFATVGIPSALTHYTTVAGAERIAATGSILPSTGATLFGNGVYATTTAAAMNPFVPVASTIPFAISGVGFFE